MSVDKGQSKRKVQIIEVAKKLFNQMGYEATSMAMILNELGIAKGTLYHHFKSKDDILMAVIQGMINEELNKAEVLAESADFLLLTPVQKLLQLIRLADVSSGNSEILEALHDKRNAYMQSQMLGYYIEVFAPIFGKVIQQGCHEGVFKTDVPMESAELLIAGLQYLTDRGFYDWSEERLTKRKQAMFTLIENQLGAAPNSFSGA